MGMYNKNLMIEFKPRDILYGTAHEILMTLKSDSIREKEQKNEINKLLGSSLAEERFAALVNLCKKITDFNPADDTYREHQQQVKC